MLFTVHVQPIMLGDAALANRMAAAMLDRGVYVVGFSYPVVPQGKARIRVQLSAGERLSGAHYHKAQLLHICHRDWLLTSAHVLKLFAVHDNFFARQECQGPTAFGC